MQFTPSVALSFFRVAQRYLLWTCKQIQQKQRDGYIVQSVPIEEYIILFASTRNASWEIHMHRMTVEESEAGSMQAAMPGSSSKLAAMATATAAARVANCYEPHRRPSVRPRETVIQGISS